MGENSGHLVTPTGIADRSGGWARFSMWRIGPNVAGSFSALRWMAMLGGATLGLKHFFGSSKLSLYTFWLFFSILVFFPGVLVISLHPATDVPPWAFGMLPLARQWGPLAPPVGVAWQLPECWSLLKLGAALIRH